MTLEIFFGKKHLEGHATRVTWSKPPEQGRAQAQRRCSGGNSCKAMDFRPEENPRSGGHG